MSSFLHFVIFAVPGIEPRAVHVQYKILPLSYILGLSSYTLLSVTLIQAMFMSPRPIHT